MRTKESNGNRLNKHDKLIRKLQKEVRGLVNRVGDIEMMGAMHIDSHIKDDLVTTKFPGSDKYLYTYDEIAEKHGVPKSRVQKIAEENDLTRRKFKTIC
ncbi:MAG: hypothetical protein GX274_07395 [Clostridiales bacterium]|jgi:hypothetical protein|nr:hypothetical protein [Bacillota bacterium]NLK91374.1 hypothetical protein [Clostridiales bacterium]